MSKLAWMITFVGLAGTPVFAQPAAQGSFPDLRGTWKGESESVVFGAGAHPHHGSGPDEKATRFTSKAFTMTIDKQDGRRFSGTFSSDRSSFCPCGGSVFVQRRLGAVGARATMP